MDKEMLKDNNEMGLRYRERFVATPGLHKSIFGIRRYNEMVRWQIKAGIHIFLPQEPFN